MKKILDVQIELKNYKMKIRNAALQTTEISAS